MEERFQQGLHVRLRLALYSQELVVRLCEPAAVLRGPENDSEQEGQHHGRRDFALGQALVGRFLELCRVDLDRLLPRLAGVDLLGNVQELVLGDVDVLDVDESVLGLLRVSEDADDSLSDRIQRGGAEHVLAAVKELGLALLPVEQEIVLKTPVQKGVVANQGIGEIGLCGSGLDERLVNHSLQLEYRQNAGLGVGNVAAEIGGKKALHIRSHGSFDENALPRQARCSDGRDDGILAFKSGGDRVYRREIGCLECHRVWKACGGGCALDDGDVEFARLDERIEHWLSKRSGGLWAWISVAIPHYRDSTRDVHRPRLLRRS